MIFKIKSILINFLLVIIYFTLDLYSFSLSDAPALLISDTMDYEILLQDCKDIYQPSRLYTTDQLIQKINRDIAIRKSLKTINNKIISFDSLRLIDDHFYYYMDNIERKILITEIENILIVEDSLLLSKKKFSFFRKPPDYNYQYEYIIINLKMYLNYLAAQNPKKKIFNPK